MAKPQTEAGFDMEVVRADPRVKAARAKQQEIEDKINDIDAQIKADEDRRARYNEMLGAALSQHLDRAHALVYDQPQAKRQDTFVSQADIYALLDERNVLLAALKLAVERVSNIERGVSAEIIKRAFPKYADIMIRQYKVAESLVAIAQEEREFIRKLCLGGAILGALYPVIWPGATVEALVRYRQEFKWLMNEDI